MTRACRCQGVLTSERLSGGKGKAIAAGLRRKTVDNSAVFAPFYRVDLA